MPLLKLTADQIEKIRAAGPEVSSLQLAEECGISERHVRTVRREARLERDTIAREALAAHASSSLTRNLDRLETLARLSEKGLQEDEKHAPIWGRLLLATVNLQLQRFDRLEPPDPAHRFEDLTDEELEELLLTEIRARLHPTAD